MSSRHAETRARAEVGPKPGISARVELAIATGDTALALRSGDVAVVGTPRLLALCEEASCRALDGHLDSGRTSVATRVQFDHLAPVPVGGTVVANATLTKVEGRRLTFTIFASRESGDDTGLIGAGRLTRVIVDQSAFLARAGATGAT